MGPNGNEYTFASFDALVQSRKDEFGAAYCDGVETQLGLTAGACTVTGYKLGSIVVVMSITGSADTLVAAKSTLTNPVVVQAIAAAGAAELSKIEGGTFTVTSSSITAVLSSSATPCLPGNHGVLCAVCDPNHARYGSTKPCEKCSSPAAAWGWAIVAAILIAVVLALVMVANRKSPTGLLRPIIDLVHRLTVMLMFTAEWPSSLREVGNAISGMMGGNVVEFVSPACIGIGGTFYSRFGLTVGIMSGTIAGIWLKAMCTIWKDKRKKKKENEGGQADAVAPSMWGKFPEGANRSEERLSTFSSRNPMVNTSDDDGDSSSSAPPPTVRPPRPGALERAASRTSIALHNRLDLSIPARMVAVIAAGQDTIIIISTCR